MTTKTTSRLAGMIKTKNQVEPTLGLPMSISQDNSMKKRINFMIDAPLLSKIDKHAKQRGISRSAMISTMASELE